MLARLFRAAALGLNSGHRVAGFCRRALSMAACSDEVRHDLGNCYRQADHVRHLIERSCCDLSEDVWTLGELFDGDVDVTYPEFLGLMSWWLVEAKDDGGSPLRQGKALRGAADSFFRSFSRLPAIWQKRAATALDAETGYIALRIESAVLRLQDIEDCVDDCEDDLRP